MPADFWLYQTIPADKLKPGTYRINCMLWVESNKKANCRLFANNNVQYYGYASDYTNLLTSGEENTYAGYAGGTGTTMELKDMEVYVTIKEGEDLSFGIKTGNKRNDGSTATDNCGWFKVDYFRITPIETSNITTSTNTKRHDHHLYALNGRKYSSDSHLTKGIYIQDAKKMIKK